MADRDRYPQWYTSEIPWIVLRCCDAKAIDEHIAMGHTLPPGWERAEPKYRRVMAED